MLDFKNWEKIKERFKSFWAKENERPIVNIMGTKDGYTPSALETPDLIADRWLDGEYVAKKFKEQVRSTYYAGEAFPLLMPDLGPDLLGAVAGGCQLDFGPDTTWAHPTLTERQLVEESMVFNPDNMWWNRLFDLTEYLLKESGGEYFVGLSDYHPGCDALVSMRGPEQLCFDILDYPDEIKKRCEELFYLFKEAIIRSQNLLRRYQEGSSTWMQVWHPDLWYVTSCDFIGMISSQMFDTFVADELQMELDFLDASIYHLDGPSAIRSHLDRLLQFEKLNGIQLCYGAGEKTARDWIAECKKVQAAGKLLHLTTAAEDLDVIMEQLSPKGLYLEIRKDPFHMAGRSFSQYEVESIMKRWFQ